MNKTNDLMLPEPEFRLKWKDGAYYVSKPSIGDTDVFTADQMREYAELVRADEREAIYDQWHSCVMSDLENGVKWLNEKAAAEWHKNYPAQSNLFPAWIETRGNT